MLRIGKWLGRQRNSYKYYSTGTKPNHRMTVLTEERVKKLDDREFNILWFLFSININVMFI